MPRFLNTALAYGEMQKIVTNAKRELVLISPYIKIPPEFLERLKDVQPDIKITIVCRKGDLTAEEQSNLRQLRNLELRFDEKLHAKCFYNEESMVIGSLNLYDHSVQNNHEMGIVLNNKDDTEVFNEARNEAGFIVNSAEEDKYKKVPITATKTIIKQKSEPAASYLKDNHTSYSISPPVSPSLNFSSKATGTSLFTKNDIKGYCIRCGGEIPQDISKPYCKDCYKKWEEWKNPDYKEAYCHICGKSNPATLNKPQCRSCYKKSQ